MGEARVIEGRLIVRESGRKTSTTRVEEASLSLDKLEIAAEGVTARGRHCQVSTIVDQVVVKKLKISAQSIVIPPFRSRVMVYLYFLYIFILCYLFLFSVQ